VSKKKGQKREGSRNREKSKTRHLNKPAIFRGETEGTAKKYNLKEIGEGGKVNRMKNFATTEFLTFEKNGIDWEKR